MTRTRTALVFFTVERLCSSAIQFCTVRSTTPFVIIRTARSRTGEFRCGFVLDPVIAQGARTSLLKEAVRALGVGRSSDGDAVLPVGPGCDDLCSCAGKYVGFSGV